MENQDRNLTQLENEIFWRLAYIEAFLIKPKYLPQRVEPGLGFELHIEAKWSKFVGETLFINQFFLHDNIYRSNIFWREAFLFFAPKVLRDAWWVRLLANAFVLAVKSSTFEKKKWKELWLKTSPEFHEIIVQLLEIIASKGEKGIILIFNEILYGAYLKQETNKFLDKPSAKITNIDLKKFSIILSSMQLDSTTISDGILEIMKSILIKQTKKPSLIEKYSFKHLTTISKIIKKLLAMNILQHRYMIDFSALGLTQYLAILICTKKQKLFLSKPPLNPYIWAQKFNCLNTCVVTQYYISPKSDLFHKYIIDYCNDLLNENKIIDFYTFEVINSYRSYNFNYFNTRIKTQMINFQNLTIEGGLFRSNTSIFNENEEKINNIIVPSGVFGSKIAKLDEVDLKILNQFLSGNDNRRIIQKNIKKDMNETNQRIKLLMKKKLIFELIYIILPDCKNEVTLYIEETQQESSKNSHYSLQDRIIHFANYLPNVYVGYINGSYKGVLLLAYLPHSTTIEMVDFFNWYLPDNVNNHILLGRSLYQKYNWLLDEYRWNNGNWIFTEEDFKG